MIIFSGIQPTGRKHLGNYIGAIRQYVEGQDRGAPAIYCIVDLHALTVPWDPSTLRANVYDTTAILIAAGLDPERCILFRQSDVREHTELTWYLGALTAHGDLNRMTQFKEKSAKQRELVSAGLFFYPVLQAADVLAYKTNEVPVGEDQRQHIELAREIARRFNERFGPCWWSPSSASPRSVRGSWTCRSRPTRCRRPGAPRPGRCWSSTTRRPSPRVRSAVTDSGSEVKRGDGKEGIANLIEILAVARGATEDEIEREFEGSGYGDFKATVAEAVVDFLAPVRERYEELRPDEAALENALGAGAEKARAIASETLAEVRSAIGVGPARRGSTPLFGAVRPDRHRSPNGPRRGSRTRSLAPSRRQRREHLSSAASSGRSSS